MKKNIALMLTLLFTGSTLLFTGCKKDEDEVPPVISLVGSNDITHAHGTPFVDPGFSASDNEDGDITSRVTKSGVVDINTIGTYTLTYNVSDRAGNAAAPVTRRVHVTYTGAQRAGQYATVEDCGGFTDNYTIDVGSSTSDPFRVTLNNFYNTFTNPVVATLKGNTITIALQQPDAPGDASTVSGSGTMSTDGDIWTINFKVAHPTFGDDNCTITMDGI